MTGVVSSRVPVEVRQGQVWEFRVDGGPVHTARVTRITLPMLGVRYVFLKRLAGGRSLRVPLRRLRYREEGARLVEDAPVEAVETKPRRSIAEVAEPPPPSRRVHEPRISAADRQHAVARAHLLRARGMTVAQIAEALCVMPEVAEVWLAEEPAEGA